ncbi:nipped-B-like protein isoform X1 [Oculina patagonica]
MDTSVPIATLAGITSLTDLLPELPFPGPSSSNRTDNLLHSPKVAEEAREILNRPERALVQQLSQALCISKSTTDQLILKDGVNQNDDISCQGAPLLLQAIISQTPHVFSSQPVKTVAESYQDPQGFSPVGYNHMSPHQRVSPTKVRSPMYAGSPGALQPQSPYRHAALQQSPPDQAGPRQMASSPHQFPVQNHAVPYSPYSGTPQGAHSSAGHSRAETSGLVNGGSPNVHLMQPHLVLSPTQTFSPVKTRRMRQGLSNSEPQLKTNRDVPNVNQGALTAPRQNKEQRTIDLSTTVRRNLNETEFYHQHAAQSQDGTANVYNQGPYDSLGALEALASQNGFNFDASVLGQASQQLAALTEKQRNAHLHERTSEQPQVLQQEGHIGRTSDLESHSKSKKRRKSSRSRSEPDIENNPVQLSSTQLPNSGNVELNSVLNTASSDKCLHRRPSRSSRKSVDEHYGTNSDASSDAQNLAPMSAKDLNIEKLNHLHVLPNRTELHVPTSPNRDQRKDQVPCISPTLKLSPALKGIQLYVPKLVITKIKQRRGSKEVETHQVREILPGTESDLPRSKKRQRSSDEKMKNDSSHDSEEAPPKKKSKSKKQKVQESHESEDIMETPTFKKLGDLLENLFEFDDECNAPSFHDLDDQEPNPETLLSRSSILEFYTETAKLKSLGVLHKVPSDDLMRLLNIMERHIRDGLHLQLQCNADQDDDEEQRLWRDLCLDRMVRAVESSLVVLIILTSPSMPKQLYLEEVINRVISLTKFQLKNNIFPEYDPIYRESDPNESALMMPKAKRAKSSNAKLKSMSLFYNKVCELVSLLGDLVDIQALTDTDILQVSNLGTSPFFVENISDLQHSALKLVRSIFRKYIKHRDLILEDIFASLARLPSSKRTLRSYRLSRDLSIQMVTALVLQLIQCSVKIPEKTDEIQDEADTEDGGDESKPNVDRNLLIITSYENALRTAQNFLSMFLNKCISVGKDEEDYRPLFENFLQDLLVTLNRPDWPAAEVLLTLLGRLLIVTFNNKSNDVSLRVSAIDYLGVVAAHLRKDAVNSQQDTESITEILVEQLGEVSDDSSDEVSHLDERSDKRNQILQKAVANWLNSEGNTDAAFMFARQFFLAQWIRDNHVEMERSLRSPAEDPLDGAEGINNDALLGAQSIAKLEDKKAFLLSILDGRNLSNFRSSRNCLDYEQATLVTRHLASSRSFSKSFDAYLSQILRVLNESAVAIRTKAMKALSAVISADPSILSRDDMQKGVHAKFVDMSTSVREAAVELIGRFVLNKPELILQYYDMIIERILDTGISVRKRVIKILRDICISHPDFPKATEICVKIIRRICDEEGIKELVTKVFQQMWFTPLKGDENSDVLVKRVVHMTDVVAACGESGDWFEQLLENLLHNEEDSISKASEEASRQIVNCLVENVLSLEEKAVAQSEGKGSSSQRLVSSLSSLYLISKIKPQLLVKHAMTLQPYLSTKCSTQGDYLVIHNVARILELVVPLMEHPSESFLASLEEDLMRLTVKYGQTVVQSCISCLGAVVNKVTHNIRLVKDYFLKYHGYLAKSKADLCKNPSKAQVNRPTLLRSLFTLGLLCKQFDFDSDVKPKNEQGSTKDRVFAVYIYFTKHSDEEVCQKAITGLGFLCMRYGELLLKGEAKDLYQGILSQPNQPLKLKLQVLKNLQTHLLEEEKRLHVQDHHRHRKAEKEKENQNLKELGDSQSGTTSAVMQVYLKSVLESFLHPQPSVRMAALHVVNLILRQGLVHPVQCVPYLIAIGTDEEQQMRVKSDQQLSEIDSKYSMFVQMKALAGIKMSFELQRLCHKDKEIPIRGFRKETNQCLLGHLYSIIRTGRQPRRSLLQSMLRIFDDHKGAKADLLLYIADNMAHFPYSVQEEPLFVIYHIDNILSVTGANLLHSFREAMTAQAKPTVEGGDNVQPVLENEYEEEETFESVLARIPPDPTIFEQCCVSSQGCLLLLYLKQHLKEMYGFSDSKCHKYSPSEPTKAYDKTVSRKAGVVFNPEQVLRYVEEPDAVRSHEQLVRDYLEFKCLMMKLDPSEEDSDDSGNGGRESPTGEGGQMTDLEGNVKTPGGKPREKRAPKPRKVIKGRKTPQAKTKPKGKTPKKKIASIDLDQSLLEDSDEDVNLLCQ